MSAAALVAQLIPRRAWIKLAVMATGGRDRSDFETDWNAGIARGHDSLGFAVDAALSHLDSGLISQPDFVAAMRGTRVAEDCASLDGQIGVTSQIVSGKSSEKGPHLVPVVGIPQPRSALTAGDDAALTVAPVLLK